MRPGDAGRGRRSPGGRAATSSLGAGRPRAGGDSSACTSCRCRRGRGRDRCGRESCSRGPRTPIMRPGRGRDNGVLSRRAGPSPSQTVLRYDPPMLALVPIAAALACTSVILFLLKRGDRLPLDHPNERSLHERPVPRVGGIGIVAGVLLTFALVRAEPVLAALVAALAAISYLDDRAHLPIALRFGAHAVAAAAFVLRGGARPAPAVAGRVRAHDDVGDESLQLHGRLRRPRRRHGVVRVRRPTQSPPGSRATRCSRSSRRASPRRRPHSSSSTSLRRASSWATRARSRSAFLPRRSGSWDGSRASGRSGFRCWCSPRSSSTRA